MAESQFPTESGDLEFLLDLPEVAAPEPMISNFEDFGVVPVHAKLLRRLQYSIWTTETTQVYRPEQSYTSRLMQTLLHLPSVDQEKHGLRVKSITECMKWGAAFGVFLPFVKDYPNPQVWFSTIIYNLRVALTNYMKCTPGKNSLLPCLLAMGAAAARGQERMVSGTGPRQSYVRDLLILTCSALLRGTR